MHPRHAASRLGMSDKRPILAHRRGLPESGHRRAPTPPRRRDTPQSNPPVCLPTPTPETESLRYQDKSATPTGKPAARLCLLPGPRSRSRVWVRQAAKNQQTLIRNPAKGEQGSESPQSGPAKPSCVGSNPTVASRARVIVTDRIGVSRNWGDPCASFWIPYRGHGYGRRSRVWERTRLPDVRFLAQTTARNHWNAGLTCKVLQAPYTLGIARPAGR